MDDSVIKYDEINETTKTVQIKSIPTKSISTEFNEKEVICKMKNFYFLLAFLLITMILSITISIYFFKKYCTKQKHFVLHNANVKKINIKNIRKMESNELKETDMKNRKCYYFDIIKIEDFEHLILTDEKLFLVFPAHF